MNKLEHITTPVETLQHRLANSGCVHKQFALAGRRRTEREVALEAENKQLREALGRINGQQDEKENCNNV